LYKDTYDNVNFGEGITRPIPIERGVKQGISMASSLYCLGIEPWLKRLSDDLRKIKPGLFASDPDTNLIAYADWGI